MWISFLCWLTNKGYKIQKFDESLEVSPVDSGYYALTQRQKEEMEAKIKHGLESVANTVAEYELLMHDLRRYKEFLKLITTNDEHALRAIFIDEVDALLPKRAGQTSTVMQRVVPQFLAEMDGIDSRNDNILIMAATNMPWNLDSAALRPGRFDFKFYIPLPDFKARRKIFELNLLDVPHEDLDFDLFAELTEGYSGADIKLICDEVKREMFKREIRGEGDILTSNIVIEVIRKVKPSVDEKLLKKYEEYAETYWRS